MRPIHQTQTSALAALRAPTGEYGVGVVIKRVLAYARPVDRAAEVTFDSTYDGDLLLAEADTAAVHRPCVDVVVHGSVYAPAPRPFIDASVRLGGAFKRVRVHGERHIHASATGVAFEPAAPIREARLSYTNAYGGRIVPPRARRFQRSEVARDAFVYPRNPVGRGFALAANRADLDGALAPSQEDPADPITPERLVRRDEGDWRDAPIPASFGAVSLAWYPRAEHVLPARGAASPDIRALSAASPGLGAPSLAAVERLELRGMRWGKGTLELALPLAPPRARLTFPGAGSYDLETRLGGVTIDADAETVTLVFCAFQPTAMPYAGPALEEVRLDA
jgi:hypothetical protein